MSRFPHPGYPIAPPLLRPILSIGLPVSYARLAGDFPLLADLGENIWAYVDQSVANILGDLVITRAGQMRSAPFWRLAHFPKLTQGLQLADIQIERPTYECLSSALKRELPDGLASLEQFTLKRAVSEIPSFGVRPLVDLLTALHFHTIDARMAVDPGDRLSLSQLQRIIQNPGAWRSYSDRYLPLLPKTASLEEMRLSVRAQNCIAELVKDRIIFDFSDLSRLTVGQIMERSNFGFKSLVELLDEIQPLVLESDLAQASTPQVGVASYDQLSSENIQQIASQSRPLADFLGLRFPSIPATTKLADMQLDVRTNNCITELIKADVISKPSDLSKLTLQQIMGTKNFGRKSLRNLLRSIEELQGTELDTTGVFELGTTKVFERESPQALCSDLTRAAEKLAQSRVASRIRCGDPRFSKLCGDLLYAANSSSDYPPLDLSASLQQIALRLAASVVRHTDRRLFRAA